MDSKKRTASVSNEVLNVIKERRSIRTYKAAAIPEEILNAVLEAGTFAPTGGGKQSPIIVAITSSQYRKKIAELNAEVMGAESDPYYGAPVVVLVLADGNTNTFIEDGSCVLENMMLGGMGNALASIQSASEFKTCYEASWIAENGRKACELAVKHGVTHIRAFADVDNKGKLEGIKALLKVREEYKQKVELQVVAFPQDGVLREPGTKDLIEEALNMWGCPSTAPQNSTAFLIPFSVFLPLLQAAPPRQSTV